MSEGNAAMGNEIHDPCEANRQHTIVLCSAARRVSSDAFQFLIAWKKQLARIFFDYDTRQKDTINSKADLILYVLCRKNPECILSVPVLAKESVRTVIFPVYISEC